MVMYARMYRGKSPHIVSGSNPREYVAACGAIPSASVGGYVLGWYAEHAAPSPYYAICKACESSLSDSPTQSQAGAAPQCKSPARG